MFERCNISNILVVKFLFQWIGKPLGPMVYFLHVKINLCVHIFRVIRYVLTNVSDDVKGHLTHVDPPERPALRFCRFLAVLWEGGKRYRS